MITQGERHTSASMSLICGGVLAFCFLSLDGGSDLVYGGRHDGMVTKIAKIIFLRSVC
jgi:hypothetical protein